MEKAIRYALETMQESGINSPSEHGFVDLVRQYFVINNIDHEPMSFEDIVPYLK